jgi:hypothetical protein
VTGDATGVERIELAGLEAPEVILADMHARRRVDHGGGLHIGTALCAAGEV